MNKIPLTAEDVASQQRIASAIQQRMCLVGPRIHMLRDAAGMTQGDLERASGVSRSYVSRIENGQMTPSIGTLEKCAVGLNCSVHDLLCEDGDAGSLLCDPYIREMAPLVHSLTAFRRDAIVNRLRMIAA